MFSCDVAVVVRRGADHLVADAGSTGRVETVHAAVADRRDDDHPGVHERACAAGSRGLRPVVERVTDRHVEHVHAVRECALHRREHHVVRRRAAATEDAVGTELDARRHALHTARGRGAGPDDSGDVRAVAVAVVRIRIRNRSWAVERVRRTGGRELAGVVRVADEVPARDHAAAREVVVEDAVAAGGIAVDAVTAEVRMVVVGAGVHDRDLHACAGPPSALRQVGAGLHDRGRQVGCRRGLERDRVDRPDSLDAAEAGQLAALGRAELDRDAVEELAVRVALGVAEAGLLGLADEVRLRARELDEVHAG